MSQLKGIQKGFLARWQAASYRKLACSIMIFYSGILGDRTKCQV